VINFFSKKQPFAHIGNKAKTHLLLSIESPNKSFASYVWENILQYSLDTMARLDRRLQMPKQTVGEISVV
jgi:hypothetical protein